MPEVICRPAQELVIGYKRLLRNPYNGVTKAFDMVVMAIDIHLLCTCHSMLVGDLKLLNVLILV